MPNRTIYIRRDDVELWDNLKNKAQVISDLLNGTMVKATPLTGISKQLSSIVEAQRDAEKVRSDSGTPMNIRGEKLCKVHGTPLDNRGKCLQKGCKYA